MTEQQAAGPSTAPAEKKQIGSLILDAGALISQSPLAGLADSYWMPSSVLSELKDPSARAYLDSLQLRQDFDLHIVQPETEAILAISDFARKTGDFSVLSRPDLEVLALSYEKEVERHGQWRIRKEVGGKTGQQEHEAKRRAEKVANGTEEVKKEKKESLEEAPEATDEAVEASKDANEQLANQKQVFFQEPKPAATLAPTEQEEQEEEIEDDGEGEWITPANIQYHKNVSLGLIADDSPFTAPSRHRNQGQAVEPQIQAEEGWETVSKPSSSKSSKSLSTPARNPFGVAKKSGKLLKQPARLTVACMTGDFAVQNVLLQMGLALVGINGQRIQKVKSYVLRCHACSKICKDVEKKWCPTCGNATLIRTSVSVDAKDSGKGTDGMKVHLKPNFQYRNRGTQFSIPAPKPGAASGGKTAGSNIILREDQLEWQRAMAREKNRKFKEERARNRALEKGKDSLSVRYEEAWQAGEMFLYGNAKAYDMSALPDIGVGRKNPNERRRPKK